MPSRSHLLQVFRKARFSLLDLVLFALLLFAIIGGVAVNITLSIARGVYRAAFSSPLPQVIVAREESVADVDAYKQKYTFTNNWFTNNVPIWKKILEPYEGQPGLRYLEIGVYEGRSAIWMLENVLTDPTAKMTGIDPFDGPYKDACFANLGVCDNGRKAEMITGYSQQVLRTLPSEETYDIIYIDGSHAKEDVLEDAVLCWRLLKVNGIMIFDDYRWVGCIVEGTTDSPTDFPKTAIDAFTECFADHLKVIHNSYQLVVQKLD